MGLMGRLRKCCVYLPNTHDRWKVKKERSLFIVREAEMLHPDPDGKLRFVFFLLNGGVRLNTPEEERDALGVVHGIRFSETNSLGCLAGLVNHEIYVFVYF